ncbi:DNA polymerase [Planctomycetota bacterium]|nr:DNA polymerase [Planctomycetota bacterium]
MTDSATSPGDIATLAEPGSIVALIDGHYFAYRYFFGMPPLTGPGGKPTGVTYAFANLFRDLRNDPAISHWALILDPHGPTFRQQIYTEYKAHRDPMPDQLRVQLPDVERLARANHVPVLSIPGYEADDLLVTIAKQAAAVGHQVRMLTRDKDVDQVLSERIRTWLPSDNTLRGPAELLAEKGLRPDQVVDYLCMIGDTSDNVPGIDGVGPKTAVKLLAEHGSLSNVLARVDTLKGKQQEKVRAFIPQAELVRRLITLVDVPGAPGLDDLRIQRDAPIDPAIYADCGFSTAKFIPQTIAPASQGARYRTVTTADLADLAADLRRAGRFALDTETTGLEPLDADIVGLSFAWGGDGSPGDQKSAVYVPVRGQGATIDWSAVVAQLGPVLTDPAVRKVGQNIKFDARVLRRHGITVAGYDGDVMLASWLLDPGRDSHGIDGLARAFLSEEKIPTGAVVDLSAGQTMADVPVERVATYACEDAQCCWRLAQLLEAKLAAADLLTVYREQEVPIALLLGRCEDAGLPVDPAVLVTTRRHLELYLASVNISISEIAGARFNPASPKQVADLLFNQLKLPVISRTKSGPSTDHSVLEALRHQHEMPDLLLQHRQLTKLIGSYLARLPEYINPRTKRIHTSLRQTGTETGRLSSDAPNLQNIPKKTDLGREMRAAFAPGPGRVLVAADYSQIELRILAHLSGDPTLCEAFHAGRDIHRFVAAAANGVSEDAVTPRQRAAAKAINFGIIYGQTAFGLANQLGIAKGDAARFISDYFARFATVKAFINRTVAEAVVRGYAQTMAGRRRYIPGLSSGNKTERMAGERVALNSTIQGSAADLIKRAMLRAEAALPADCRLVLQIHDELLVEAPEASAQAAANALAEAMRSAWKLDVPLVAEARIGKNWLEVG